MNTEKELKQLYEEYGGDVDKVAQHLGMSDPAPIPVYVAPPRRREAPADLGRPELRQFKVSARHVNHPTWPLDDETKIDRARAEYEAGTHEMCQGRDPRGWFILYSIPRVKRAGARKFFQAEG